MGARLEVDFEKGEIYSVEPVKIMGANTPIRAEIVKRTLIMNKETFIQCYNRWIADTNKHEDDCK